MRRPPASCLFLIGDKVIWAVGPSINLPIASNDQLGSGKWSAGITGVALHQPDWGTMGVLGRQLWWFAGDSDRKDVNQTLIEPLSTGVPLNGAHSTSTPGSPSSLLVMCL
jgi:hypothetical protein